MTNEEASVIIGNIPINGDECYSISEYQQAKALAIKALGQQTCEDCISREAVLDILKKYVLGESSIAEEVIDLQPVTPKPTRWIPVSERLPEEDAVVLVCTSEEELFITEYLGIIDGEPFFDDYDGNMWDGDVIAWMSLPDPYKEAENADSD